MENLWFYLEKAVQKHNTKDSLKHALLEEWKKISYKTRNFVDSIPQQLAVINLFRDDFL